MIKIVEIKGGLRELQERRDFPFDKQQSLWEKEKGPGLQEQLRSYQDFQGITRAQLELAMGLTEPRNRENEIVIHTSREGYRQFQEALSEEISSESNRILAEERRRETIRTLQQMQNMPIILDTRGIDEYIDRTPLTPHSAYFRNSPRQMDPDTGNIEVLQSDGNSITFSRDMTEEQMIAYFDSLD